jgi:hypothetical protein
LRVIMVIWTIVLAASLTTQLDAKRGPMPPRPDLNEPAAEVITLRDGSTILGQVLATPRPTNGSGSKGVQPILVLVRRAWAEAHQRDRLAAWDRAGEPEAKRAVKQQRERLAGWRRERSASLTEDQRRADRILTWIDRRIEQLDAPGNAAHSPLLMARISRGDVKALERKPATVSRLLATAWLCNLPEPETMTAGQLKEAVEGRGLVADVSRPVALDNLLPPIAETESQWLTRRAATEVTVDPDLRFLRFQDLVLPDSKDVQSLDQVGLASGLSELQNLLNPGENRPDPLVARFEKIEASGRIGAQVTRLTISPDLASASVEIALWVRAGARRWLPAGSQTASVRSDDLGPDAGNDLADDPQIQSVFKIAEGLGLGQAAGELKQRSLRIGAATRKALGLARSAAETDFDALAFPVFKPVPEADDDPDSRPANPPVNGKPGE